MSQRKMYFFAWQRLFFSVRDLGVNYPRLLMNYYKRRGEADTDKKKKKKRHQRGISQLRRHWRNLLLILYAGAALSHRDVQKTFTMVSPGWQDGRWGEGVIRFCRCLREIETSFCLHTVFCLHRCVFLHLLLFFASSLCLSVLCGVSTLVITPLTDAGLQAMQHLSLSASLPMHSHVCICSKTPPPYSLAILRFGKQRHARTPTWHV